MTAFQAGALLVLWRSGRFDTHDIARLLHVTEADVVRVLDAVRNREHGPSLRVVP